MLTMHGFFDLRDESAEVEYKTDYEKFGAHLIEQELITGFRVMRRSYHAGYDSGAPDTRFYISMDFLDLVQANRCWDYIEARPQPSHKFHAKVYAQIKNATFFLSEDIPTGS